MKGNLGLLKCTNGHTGPLSCIDDGWGDTWLKRKSDVFYNVLSNVKEIEYKGRGLNGFRRRKEGVKPLLLYLYKFI